MEVGSGFLTWVARRMVGSLAETRRAGEKAMWRKIIYACVGHFEIEVLTGHPSQCVNSIPLAGL